MGGAAFGTVIQKLPYYSTEKMSCQEKNPLDKTEILCYTLAMRIGVPVKPIPRIKMRSHPRIEGSTIWEGV